MCKGSQDVLLEKVLGELTYLFTLLERNLEEQFLTINFKSP